MNRILASITVAVSIFLPLTGQATTVLVDFDDVTPQDVYGGNLSDIETKGFTFDANTLFASPPEAGVGSGGIYATADCFAWGGGCGSEIIMSAISGGQFSIQSIGSSEGSFSGTVFGGGVANLAAPIGTGDWLNLQSFSVSNFCPSTPCLGYWTASLDDVTVSAVPVPAAVWLFGSALAGLGWMRRKQTA